jgi:hypothetical protein
MPWPPSLRHRADTWHLFTRTPINRVIEIRGDQTLEDLHHAIFKAYDRFEEHKYQFQLGRGPFDPDGPNFGIPGPPSMKKMATGTHARQSWTIWI